MGGDLDIPREAILAGIGLFIALLLLVFLSLYQQAMKKKSDQAKLKKLDEETSGVADASAGTTPFFIACFRGNNARYFRVYSGVDELLFLYAGQYFVMIDPESPRGTDKQHWLLRSLKMALAALASGAVAAIMVLAIILRAIARNAAQNPNGGGHIITIVMAIIGLLGLLVVIIVPTTLWGITRRCRELDALSLNGLRGQAEIDKRSFRATPDSIKEFKVQLLDQRENFKPSQEVGSIISFKHKPTGRWKIETLTTADTRDAIQAIFAIWDRDQVEIDEKLLARFGELIHEAVQAGEEAEAVPAGLEQESVRAASHAASAEAARKAAEVEQFKTSGGTHSVNGIGTMVCEGRGDVAWRNDPEDADAILAFCFLGLPIIPYGAVHTANWGYNLPTKGTGQWIYNCFPIRWSWELLVSSYLRRYWVLLIVVGVLSILVAAKVMRLPDEAAAFLDQGNRRLQMELAGGILIAVAIAARLALMLWNGRHRNIRLIQGKHLFGSSDPVHWSDDMHEVFGTPEELFNCTSFAAASSKALEAGNPVQAMFAARLCAAREDRQKGEGLTDQILKDAKVAPVLNQIRRSARDRDDIITKAGWKSTVILG